MRLRLLWAFGAVAGILGALVLFDADPGINWTIWTIVAVTGLLAYRRPGRDRLRSLGLPLGFAIVLAAGAAVTTAPVLVVAIVAMVASLLSLALTLAPEQADFRDYGAIDIVTAPFRGIARTARGLISAVAATVTSTDVTRERPLLRGSLIAAPIVVVLVLLFAAADPFLARGRDAFIGVIDSWSAAPRVLFGLLLTFFVVGAYAATQLVVAPRASAMQSPAGQPAAAGRIGLTERRVVLGAVAAVSWLFVLLQVSYLFGTLPSAAGSGITFAEYARRGFGELAVAATGVALLIVALHQRVPAGDETRVHKGLVWPALILLAAVVCILFSAFHRVSLYEDAYGYTTARVYAQAYMILALAVLVTLAWHVSRTFDVRALARAVMTIALTTLALLVFWNGDAWVARANIERYGRTGKLDVEYLTRGLSPDAYPALARALPGMAAPERTQLTAALAHEYARQPSLRAGTSWYEWNLRRDRARHALSVLVPSSAQVGASPR
jgi:uncharacterized protein DUF4153